MASLVCHPKRRADAEQYTRPQDVSSYRWPLWATDDSGQVYKQRLSIFTFFVETSKHKDVERASSTNNQLVSGHNPRLPQRRQPFFAVMTPGRVLFACFNCLAPAGRLSTIRFAAEQTVNVNVNQKFSVWLK